MNTNKLANEHKLTKLKLEILKSDF